MPIGYQSVFTAIVIVDQRKIKIKYSTLYDFFISEVVLTKKHNKLFWSISGVWHGVCLDRKIKNYEEACLFLIKKMSAECLYSQVFQIQRKNYPGNLTTPYNEQEYINAKTLIDIRANYENKNRTI